MTVLSKENVSLERLQEGDAGIILKQNGEFQIFTTATLGKEMNQSQLVQTTRLMALVVALTTPSIMDSLILASEGIKLDLGATH